MVAGAYIARMRHAMHESFCTALPRVNICCVQCAESFHSNNGMDVRDCRRWFSLFAVYSVIKKKIIEQTEKVQSNPEYETNEIF